MEIQRQADQWNLPHREAAYDNYQPSREELREMLAGPRIHTGMLNTRRAGSSYFKHQDPQWVKDHPLYRRNDEDEYGRPVKEDPDHPYGPLPKRKKSRTAGEVSDAFQDLGDAAHSVGESLSSAEPGDSGEWPDQLPGDAVLDLLDPLTGGLSSAIKDARNYRHAYPQTDPTVKQNQFAVETQKSLQPKGVNRANPSLRQNDLAVKNQQKNLLPKKPKPIPDDLGQDKSFAPSVQPIPKVKQYKASRGSRLGFTRLADQKEEDDYKRQPTGGPAYNPPPVNQNPPAAPQAPPPQNLGNTSSNATSGVPDQTNDLANAGNPLNNTGEPPKPTSSPTATDNAGNTDKKDQSSPASPGGPGSSSSSGINAGDIAGLIGGIAGPIGGAISSLVPGLGGLSGAITGLLPSIGGLFQASRCPGSGQYPQEEHRRIEGLYRCGSCHKWSEVDVRAKLMEHISTNGTGGAAASPTVGSPGTGGAAGGNQAALAGEANSGPVAPVPPVAPTAGSGPLNATDVYTQSAGSNVSPLIRS